MPNLVSLSLMVCDKDLQKKIKFCCHGNQSFSRNQILSRNSEEDHGGKMFKIKVNAQTDGWTDRWTHDGEQAMT